VASARRFVGAIVLALVGVAGCYNPNITDAGLACGPGKVCPDNFHCASNGRCYRAVDGGLDASKPVCTSVTPNVATCSRPAAAGDACNPACESGCTCGWCGIVSGTAICLTGTPGTKQVGDACDPSNRNDCAPGLLCHAECGTGRCYKYCDPASADAGTGGDCQSIGTSCTGPSVVGSSTYRLCSLPAVSCNPVTGGGCPPGLACYPFGSGTECDCAGQGKTGDPCGSVGDCAPGYTCISIAKVLTCQKTCSTSADCPAGICSNPAMITYGYCAL